MLKTTLLILPLIMGQSFPSWSEKNTVIINNKASAGSSSEAITAPALIPSKAIQLRDARKEEEIKTEDTLIKKLEKQRLLDEQKRVDELMGHTPQESPLILQPALQPARANQWLFGKKSFVSLGTGFVTFPYAENVNSLEEPAVFFSFGGYGYNGNLIVDLSLYYARYYVNDKSLSKLQIQDVFHRVSQPELAMSVKLSPFSGQMKPYVGISGSVNLKRWSFVHKTGREITKQAHIFKKLKNKIDKKWYQSFNAGVAVGADIALGEHFGLNADICHYWNLYTDNKKSIADALENRVILEDLNSLILSFKLRYYL